ncbi:MAG: DUF1223 domain-containing protein [Burkholderiaceae bacterium]|nr:MAG: DUF1223 domain-containing protein [Burkholderiaceae bacterium]
MTNTIKLIVTCLLFTWVSVCFSMQNGCAGQSGSQVTPVIELYTSEGCSSCPPADRWLSSLKNQGAGPAAVIEAFHVGYWDNLGWVDRFTSPAYTLRQRQIAAWTGQGSIYTPQVVRNGRDWRGWGAPGTHPTAASGVAGFDIALKASGPDRFEAIVTPRAGAPIVWSAYWTVTEDGYNSKVKAGENSGAFLQDDFVVRQYTPVGEYRTATPQELTLRSIPASARHARHINLVLFDPKTGATLQAVSASC